MFATNWSSNGGLAAEASVTWAIKEPQVVRKIYKLNFQTVSVYVKG